MGPRVQAGLFDIFDGDLHIFASAISGFISLEFNIEPSLDLMFKFSLAWITELMRRLGLALHHSFA
jgi:hypothetical protein